MGKTRRKSKPPMWASFLEAHVKDSGISWAAIAKEMDMTDGGIRHWRNGTREIKIPEFIALCKAAGADPLKILKLAMEREQNLRHVGDRAGKTPPRLGRSP